MPYVSHQYIYIQRAYIIPTFKRGKPKQIRLNTCAWYLCTVTRQSIIFIFNPTSLYDNTYLVHLSIYSWKRICHMICQHGELFTKQNTNMCTQSLFVIYNPIITVEQGSRISQFKWYGRNVKMEYTEIVHNALSTFLT